MIDKNEKALKELEELGNQPANEIGLKFDKEKYKQEQLAILSKYYIGQKESICITKENETECGICKRDVKGQLGYYLYVGDNCCGNPEPTYICSKCNEKCVPNGTISKCCRKPMTRHSSACTCPNSKVDASVVEAFRKLFIMSRCFNKDCDYEHSFTKDSNSSCPKCLGMINNFSYPEQKDVNDLLTKLGGNDE